MMVVLPWRGADLSVLANGSGDSGAVCIFGWRRNRSGFHAVIPLLAKEARSGAPARYRISHMGDASVNISIADCLPYFEQRFLQIFGKDQESLDTAAWFKALQTTGMTLAAHVHCVGMQSPLPFDSIYQPTMLRMTRGHERATGGESYAYEDRASRSILIGKALEERSVTVEQFLLQGGDGIIFAGPGWGKTTFLHHIFRRFVRSEDVLPILITLRRPTALEDLERFVEVGSKIQRKHHKSRALLLVDGYDELTIEPRKESPRRFFAIRRWASEGSISRAANTTTYISCRCLGFGSAALASRISAGLCERSWLHLIRRLTLTTS